jgi:hypothetical protein
MVKSNYAKISLIILLAIVSSGCIEAQDESFQTEFNISERSLITTGRNQYFILEPGFQLVLEGTTGFLGLIDEKLIITVLDETKEVDGITTRIVEEREWKNDELYEVARNFFAIDEETGDIFSFGEEVDFYNDGKIVNHKGAWLAGKNGAKPGLIMSGNPKVGLMYYQEVAPGVAMDRAEIIKLNETLETPAGEFTNCLKTKEGTALNYFEKEYKTYAPEIGLIQDQSLLLTSYGFKGEN